MASNSRFTIFYGDWLSRHEAFLEHLERLLSPEDGFDRNYECCQIIPEFFSHYQQLYAERARAAGGDVFLLFSPSWMSSFERSLLWVSGFRPSMLFPIMERSVAEELTGEQRERIEEVKLETRRREREITQAMARVQEKVAEPPVYSMMRRFGRLGDGEATELGDAIEGFKAAIAVVVENADELRVWTAAEVVGILSPVQSVRFLAEAARSQLQARKWGIEKDREREVLAARSS
ncbi:hypothetical protein OROMI_010772 [Orobanche minor]